MQGASPLASPGLNPGGTGSPCRCGKLNGGGLPRRCRRGGRQRYPVGGLPALSPAYPATVVPAGGVPALPPVNPAFNLLPCPLPRRGRIDPRPPSRREGGDYRLFFARGFAPCIPGAEPGRNWFALPLWKTQWGACLGVAGSAGVSDTRRGGVPALSPACLSVSLLFCPLSPRPPSPVGKGEIFCFLMQGASPLASPGLNPRGTGSPCRCGKLNGGRAPALPVRRASAVPGGGRACFVACLPCHCGARGGRARFVAC